MNMINNRMYQQGSSVASFSSIPSSTALASLANSILTNAANNNKSNTSPVNTTSTNPTASMSTNITNDTKPTNTTIIQPIVRVSLSVPLFKPENLYPTPSMSDYLPYDTEFDLRLIGCELIQTAGRLLKLPQTAMATGQVIFHRYFYIKSFVKNQMEYYAMASIFLSSKIEECPRRIRDVVNVFHHIKQVRTGKVIKPMPIDEIYSETKNQVIKAERRILKELGFCVHVKHPHKIIFIYLQAMECSQLNLSQKAWNYMNDSFRTDIFLRYSPENIVCACIYLSANESQISLPQNPPWFTIFGANEETIKEICVRILHLYSYQTKTQEELDKIINDCREQINEEKRRVIEAKTINLSTETSNEAIKEESSKSAVETSKQSDLSHELINDSSKSRISPNSIEAMNILNHSNPHFVNNYHPHSHNYPIAHSSHHSIMHHANYNFNYFHNPNYMNGNDPYYDNYHNENYYEADIKRTKGSYMKNPSHYKETEEYYKKRHSSKLEEKSYGKERNKISNQTNKYHESKSRSRSKSPWKRVKDDKSKTNRNSRKRSKSRSLTSNESEIINEIKSPISKHKKKKSSHHGHRKEESSKEASVYRSRHRDERERSRTRSNSRNHQSKSSSKTKPRSKDRETRYIPILS